MTHENGQTFTTAPELPRELEQETYLLFREFFDKAEKKRRWNINEDIPWNQCNRHLNPVIADVIETFTAVELYLPDYTSKILPLVRKSKGRAWFYANWGYEESKHSLALGDWLVKSGHRTEEYMADLEEKVFAREWNLPQDNQLGMIAYAMVQEQATFLNYKKLKERVEEMGRDPALEQLLSFVSVDEKSHFGFFRDCLRIYMKHDREAVIVQLRRVMNTFAMPVVHDLLDDSARRIAEIQSLDLFDSHIYFREVYLPVIRDLGISREEMRTTMREKKSLRYP